MTDSSRINAGCAGDRISVSMPVSDIQEEKIICIRKLAVEK